MAAAWRDNKSAASGGECKAKFTKSIFSKFTIVAGIAGDSEVNDGDNGRGIIVVMLAIAVIPESDELVDAMKNNSK